MSRIKLFEEFVNEKDTSGWWNDYEKYNLSVYPVGIPKKNVKIDLSGDIDTHPVMVWDSPTTGKTVYSYTKARMDAQKEIKYARIENLSDIQIEKVKVACHNTIVSDESAEQKQAAAIISIIAQTGLRPGSTAGFMKTENKGVITLSPENIKIDGSIITLTFVGKSYKDNFAEIEDGVLANYLTELIKKKKKNEFVFDVSKSTVDTFYKKSLNMSEFKIKDLRTYIANKIAKQFLETSPLSPPPIPKDSSQIKKLVKIKLKHAFEYVSNKLNNTPAMARDSYINPAIIDNWLESLGIMKKQLVPESEEIEGEDIKVKGEDGNVPIYKLPNWWDSDEIELVEK
jgi:DNA topoisomerase I